MKMPTDVARDLTHLLAGFASRIRDLVPGVVDELCDSCNGLSDQVGDIEWRNVITPVIRQHELWTLCQEDPYTRRAWSKPRGYAGDAEMLDYVYFQQPPTETSIVGVHVFHGTTGSSNGRSVRHRRQVVADEIDRVTKDVPSARITAIASGHLREVELSGAIKNRMFGQFIALDQDEASLARIPHPITPMRGSVKDILGGQLQIRNQNLVYTTGLFDYLRNNVAEQLIACMCEMLEPGGVLLVGNFEPRHHGRCYMDAFMDWRLVGRDQGDLEQLCNHAKLRHQFVTQTFRDPFGNVAYLRATMQS